MFRKWFAASLILSVTVLGTGSSVLAAAGESSRVILVDDFDQAYSSNHLGGAYGIVAQGGEARYDFIRPPIPYLANNSALKVSYKLKSNPGFAFLWMKLGKHNEAHELTDYLNLNGFVFLSFKYQTKQDINFKVELHEDIDNNGRFDIQRDRMSFVYLDTVKKIPIEGGWTKVLMPLKRFNGIKNWSKMLEMVFVFEKDRGGEAGEIFFDDVIFIRKEIKREEEKNPLEFIREPHVLLNGAPAASGASLKGENKVLISYKAASDFENLESLSLEIKTPANETWLPVTSDFNPGRTKTEILWEASTFIPPEELSMRVTAHHFLGKSKVLAGPFEKLKVPKMTDEEFLELVTHKAFNFFNDNQNSENGLFYDTTGGGDLSTAVTGFGLSALVIGAERGWISKAEAAGRVKKCLESFLKIEDKEGFYYHFLTAKTLKRAGTSEISTVDTALLLTGVITAGEYFGGDIKKLSEKLYKKANWDFYLNKNQDEEHFMQFHHGWTPEEKLVDNYWDYYTDETLLLDLLAIGAPAHKVPADIFYKFQRRKEGYKNQKPFIYTWHGSLFSYQYANAWFDFRNIVDKEGVNWYENSKQATLSNREFAIDHATEYKTYGPDSWGITSMRVPERYVMHYGPIPNGQNLAEHDGTISPSGPGGSMMFTPYFSLRTLKNLYIEHPDLWGIYGFKDSLNVDRYWISPIYYGLGEGILLLSIENFRTGLIWDTFGKNKGVKKGFAAVGFKPDDSKRPVPSLFAGLKKEIDAAPQESRLDMITRVLEREWSYPDLNLLFQETQLRYVAPEDFAGKIVLGKIQAKMIESLQVNDVELGRQYLKNAALHQARALQFFDEALQGPLSEVERLEVFKEKIYLMRQVLDAPGLDAVQDRLTQELKDGIKRRVYNLAWALKWAESLDEDTAFKLQRQFYEDLSGRERKVLFELLKRKTRAAFAQGDYRKAAVLSEEQIRFMEAPQHRRVLIGYLARTANAFSEVQKFAEAERFYLKIIENYGEEKDKEKMIPALAVMFEKKGDKERAVKEFERFIEFFPRSEKVPEAMTRIANLESSLGNREKSIELLKRVSENYPASAYAEEGMYLLGMVYFHANQFRDAIKTWEKYLQAYPDSRHVSIVRDYLERADKKEAKK